MSKKGPGVYDSRTPEEIMEEACRCTWQFSEVRKVADAFNPKTAPTRWHRTRNEFIQFICEGAEPHVALKKALRIEQPGKVPKGVKKAFWLGFWNEAYLRRISERWLKLAYIDRKIKERRTMAEQTLEASAHYVTLKLLEAIDDCGRDAKFAGTKGRLCEIAFKAMGIGKDKTTKSTDMLKLMNEMRDAAAENMRPKPKEDEDKDEEVVN